jgi:hypothetical protein
MSIWKNGKPIDLWSLVHFFSGFLLGGLFYWLGTEFLYALGLTLFLLVLWEGFEYATRIIEPIPNVAADIIIGLTGFFIASWLYHSQITFDPGIYLTLLATNIILGIWGFLDFTKRGSR